MSKYAIKNVEGAQVAEAELADGVFGIEPNIPVIHQVVVCQDSCARQGTHALARVPPVPRSGPAAVSSLAPPRAPTTSALTTRW